MHGSTWVAEPFGAVEMPEMLVSACEELGLPLGPNPVPSDVKANQEARAARKRAENSDMLTLKKRVAEAESEVIVAKEEIERVGAELSASTELCDELQKKLTLSEVDRKQAIEDAAAMKKELEELSKEHAAIKNKPKPRKAG